MGKISLFPTTIGGGSGGGGGGGGAASYPDDTPLVLGTSSDASLRWGVAAQTEDTLILGLGDTAQSLIITDTANVGDDFDHAAQSQPTIFVQSNYSPTLDNGLYVSLSYLGLIAGTMENDFSPWDLTVSAPNASSISTGGHRYGGDLILVGGAGNAGAPDGIVKVGSTFNNTNDLFAKEDLGVAGKLEVNGITYLDLDTFIGVPASTTTINAGYTYVNSVETTFSGTATIADTYTLAFGTSGAGGTYLVPDATLAQLTLAAGPDHGNALVFGGSSWVTHDFDHASQTDPTLFVHSIADPDTENGQFLGLSYLGLTAGTMQNDSPTYDFTIKASNAYTGGGASNPIGGKLILEGGTGETGTDGGIVQVGSTFSTSHSLNSDDSLGVQGKLEVNGDTHLDGWLYTYGTIALSATSAMNLGDGKYISFGTTGAGGTILRPYSPNTQMVLGVGTDSGRALTIADRAYYNGAFDHAVQVNPTLFVQSVLDPNTDNGEYLGISYTTISGGTMETDRSTYDFTIKASNAYASAATNVTGGNLILEGGTGKTATDGGIVQVGSGFTTSHGLNSENDLGVTGKLEVDGIVYMDSNVFMLDNKTLSIGSSADAKFFWGTAQTNDSLLLGLGASRTFILCEAADITTNHQLATQSDPAIFAVSSAATVGESVGLSYASLFGGTFIADNPVQDFTIKASNAYASAVTNVAGGKLILEGGTGKTATDGGIVQIGSGFSSSQGLDAKEDMGVVGDLEVDGLIYADGGVEFPSINDLGGGASATLGTVGTPGPTTSTQAKWLPVTISGSSYFIPVWA